MKRVTASEARKNWFRILDEVAAGGVVVVHRHGRRIVLRREEVGDADDRELPDYGDIIRVADVSDADDWGWEWRGPEGALVLRERDGP
jgi:antitoxin (DNA-binding transcriptional repressor) of toxin-antitoxin stability system